MKFEVLITFLVSIVFVNRINCQTCPQADLTPTPDCTKFYRCNPDGSIVVMPCPSGLLFDSSLKVCNWPYNVKCTSLSSSATVKTTTQTKTSSRLTTLLVTTSITTQEPSTALCTQSEFNNAVTSNGYPSPTLEQYQNLVNQAQSKGGIKSKQELAMFLAEILWESDGLRATREYFCYPTLNPGCEYSSGTYGYPGQYYFGRGYIQLTWDYNYKAASEYLFGNADVLLKDPDQVATKNDLSWSTAFWFWKFSVIGGTYGQQVLSGKFGAATNAINGALECRGAYQDKARQRFQLYKKVLVAFNLNVVADETGCYN